MSEMEHKIEFPTLMFFQNGNGWKGSSGLLRFHIEPAVEREEEKVLPVSVWCGPFCRELSQVDDSAEFPLSQEGLETLNRWLEEWSVRMNEHPTHTPEETLAYSRKAKEKKPE